MQRVALLVWFALAQPVGAAELCRYAGDAGRGTPISVRTDVSSADGAVTVEVTVELTASSWFSNWRYQGEEVSTWRGGELQGLAVNNRWSVDGAAKRQQWDVWARGPAGLEARRVQAKTLADFQLRHPGFVQHWSLATFGQPWLRDYAAASPERRPDLDIARQPGLRTPGALTFYWSRFLPADGGAVTIVLPGFKRQTRAGTEFAAATVGEGWRLWRTPLLHDALSRWRPSSASAWVSADHHLLQVTFDVHASLGSAQGIIRLQGCQGAVVLP